MPPGLSDPDRRPPEVDGCCSVQPTSLGPLLPQELERHVDAFNLAEPVFGRCPFAALLQIGLKVVEPANHGWLDLQDRASEAGVFVLTGVSLGAAAFPGLPRRFGSARESCSCLAADQGLAVTRDVSGVNWCAQWCAHPEAVSRIYPSGAPGKPCGSATTGCRCPTSAASS